MRDLELITEDLMYLGVPAELAEYLAPGLIYTGGASQFDLAQILANQIPAGATQTIVGSTELDEILFLCPAGEAFRLNSAGDIQHNNTDWFISGLDEDDNQAVILVGGHTYGLSHGASIIVGGRYHGHPGQVVIMGGGGAAPNAVMIATGEDGESDGHTRLTFRTNGDYAWRGDPQLFYSEGGTANTKSFYLCGGQSGSIDDGAIAFVSGIAEETLLGACGFLGANVATGHIQDKLGHTSAIWKVIDSGGGEMLTISDAAKFSIIKTNTAAGTTGAQTINRPSGKVNFAAGASSLVVTNSLCSISSIVFCAVLTDDTTAVIKNVVPGSGSFTIKLAANATAETSVGFWVIN